MQEDRDELISGLFAIMTASLEDMAALALDGQGPLGRDCLHDLAERVVSGAEQVITLGRAVRCLVEEPAPSQSPKE